MNSNSQFRGSNFQYQMSQAALAAVGSGAALAILMFIGGFAAGSASVVYASMALLAFLIPAATGLLRGRQFDIFEPVNLIAGAVLFATTIRAFYLMVSDSSRAEFLMMGTSFDAVNAQIPWMLLGIAALSIGYIVVPYRVPLERLSFVQRFTVSRGRLWTAIGFATVTGLVGVSLFMTRFGISLADGILALSRKRAAEFVGDSGEIIYGKGYEVFLGQFSQYGFILLAAVLCAGLLRWNGRNIGAVSALFFLSIIVPFMSSSRSSILLLLIIACILAYYYGRIHLKAILIATVIAAAVVTGMGALREFNQQGAIEREGAVDAIVGSGNGIDFVRTAAIMERVPSVRPFQNGTTYAALITSVIPRGIWPEKPNPSMGVWIKGELFGQSVRKNGWPPGMIAEAYINFGIPGIPIVMFIFGGLLRVFYESCRPHLGVSLPITILYAVSIWRLAFGTIGLNFAHGILQVLQYVIPMLALLWLAKSPRRRRGYNSALAAG